MFSKRNISLSPVTIRTVYCQFIHIISRKVLIWTFNLDIDRIFKLSTRLFNTDPCPIISLQVRQIRYEPFVHHIQRPRFLQIYATLTLLLSTT